MATLNVYLNFDGNCLEAFKFYQSVFGGEFSHVGTFRDVPPSDSMPPLSEQDLDRVLHISLPISVETVLMGSDTFPGSEKLTQGNNYTIAVGVSSKAQAETYFAALSDKGVVSMPMSDTFWGSYFGMLVDQFGIQWMIDFDAS